MAVFGALIAGTSGFMTGMHTALLVAAVALLLATATVALLLPRRHHAEPA